MIEVRNLSYRYDGRQEKTLKEIQVTIGEGEYVVIMGPNGCGKTTLIRHLNALLRPEEGEVWVDGMSTKDHRVLHEIRQRVGMVFGNPDDQLVGMTVEEDVSFGPGNRGLPPPEIRRRVEEALGAVGMGKYAKAPPHLLSEGEKQLVAIAGVLSMNPRYIALDEPTAYLDPSARRRVLEIMLRLNREGITIIHVTHHMEDLAHADRVMVMEEGRLLWDETPARMLSLPDELRRVGLGLPRVSELLWRLKEMGLDVNPCVLDVAEACHEILSRMKSASG